MKTVLALALAGSLTACFHQETTRHDKQDFGDWLGQSTASPGSNPSHPLAKDPDVTEGGGMLRAFVGTGGGGVTPTVGEKPDTLEQAKGPVVSDMSGGTPGNVYVPAIPNFQGGVQIPINPPTATITVQPSPNPAVGPVTGPVTGAGPNGPGTGTGPATPTGPATGTFVPTPSPSGPTAVPVQPPGTSVPNR